jgi:predicted ester cyclase
VNREPVSERETIPGYAETAMNKDAIAALFARRQEAYDTLDAATLAADYTDDVLIDSPISGQHGKAEAMRGLEAVFDAFVDMRLTTVALIVDSPWVAQTVIIEGSNLGGLFGLPPNGRPFRISAAFIYRLRGDRIAFEQRIYDFTGLLAQVGVRKGPAGFADVGDADRGGSRPPEPVVKGN